MSTKKSNSLTSAQKTRAIGLFTKGVTAYTKISEELNVPYKAVNSFMTKWKHKTGVLPKRKVGEITTPVVATSTLEALPVSSEYELAFLRDFYFKTISTVQEAILKRELVDRRLTH